MLNIAKIARAAEWWEYKLPTMLAIVYATVIKFNKHIVQLAPILCVWLLGIIIGAAYVSILNDLTDLKEDEASGKKNRLSKLPVWLRFFLILFSVALGVLFAYWFIADPLSFVFYLASWIVFGLYSIPPFRFKKRGILGVLADACGAHLFPTLFLLSSTIHFFLLQADWFWFSIVAIWSLMYGLRGILWHQFFDRENDLKIGINTYASNKNPDVFKKKSSFLIIIELAALFFILFSLSKPLPILGLLLYSLMLLGYRLFFRLTIISIVPPPDRGWHLAMNSYYQFILPLSLLLSAVCINPQVGFLIVAHLVLFPVIARSTIMDLFAFLKIPAKKIFAKS